MKKLAEELWAYTDICGVGECGAARCGVSRIEDVSMADFLPEIRAHDAAVEKALDDRPLPPWAAVAKKWGDVEGLDDQGRVIFKGLRQMLGAYYMAAGIRGTLKAFLAGVVPPAGGAPFNYESIKISKQVASLPRHIQDDLLRAGCHKRKERIRKT